MDSIVPEINGDLNRHAIAILCTALLAISSLLSVTGCGPLSSKTQLSVANLRVLHHTEARNEGKQEVETFLVEREHGGLTLVTEYELGYYDADFNYERRVRFRDKYTGFGVIQGPNGFWFAGFEWWSWNFGILHKMNFGVHAMPLGEAIPTYEWICKSCTRLHVDRVIEPTTDIVSSRRVGTRDYFAFDISTGDTSTWTGRWQAGLHEKFGAERFREPANELDVDPFRSSVRYGSDAWWRYAYGICPSRTRLLRLLHETPVQKCVWHPLQDNLDNEYWAKFDRTYKKLVLTDGNENVVDSWDLAQLAGVSGFSTIAGWYRIPTRHATQILQRHTPTHLVLLQTFRRIYTAARRSSW